MIPKTLHLCWLSGNEFPPLIAHCIESWHKILPDYNIIIWDRNKIDIETIPWVKQAFKNEKYAFAADYIRMHALYYEGGIYLDSDVEVVKSFNDLLQTNSFMGLETGGDFEPGIIGAEKGCAWIGKCLEYYKERTFIKDNGSFDTIPLPVIVGNILKNSYGIESNIDKVTTYDSVGLKLYTSDYFSPKSTHTGEIRFTMNTRSIHHFDGSWVKKNFKFKLKTFIHRFIIMFFGQEGHNLLIKKLR